MFVVFEGTEGAGKSTLLKAVAERARESGRWPGVAITREPGGSPVAERIRELILANPMDPLAELLLYEAARAEHVARTILPALTRGELVLCDRFTASTLAYQAGARGLDWKMTHRLNQMATRGLRPDLTVLLDIDPAEGLRRARVQTRFEAEGVTFQKKVRLGFLKARREEPARWLTLKVKGRSVEDLADTVLARLSAAARRRLPRRMGLP